MSEIKKEQNNADLKSRLQDITERISLKSSAEKANDQRSVSSAIGVESPIGVLSEIRELQGRTVELMKELLLAQEEKEKRDEARHTDLCTLLMGMSMSSPSSSQQSYTAYGQNNTGGGTPRKSHSYYGNTAITSGTHLVSCVLMHLDAMLIRHPQFRKIQNTDKTFMDMKEWYVLCNAVLNADKSAKSGLRMPKPSDEDFKSACRLIASPVEGRRPTCDASSITALLTQSPALMNTVEWTRTALLRCLGCLSPERYCRFKLIKYPFVNDDSELEVEQVEKVKVPKRDRHQEVMDLKITERKEYMRLILEDNFTSGDALNRVKKIS